MRPSRETIGERSRTHGMTETRLYKTWCGMKARCTNSNYRHFDRYGGRGISVCPEWEQSFESFRDWAISNGYDETKSGREQSLDRIDVNGNYCPSNCRWVDMLQQARNRADTVYVNSPNGKISARLLAEQNGIPDYVYVYRKALKGKSADEIVSDWKFLSGQHPEYVLIKEASEFFGVTDQSICDWIKSGKLLAEKHGQKWYIPRSQLIQTK